MREICSQMLGSAGAVPNKRSGWTRVRSGPLPLWISGAMWAELRSRWKNTLPPSLRRYLARTFVVVQKPELHHPRGQKVVGDPAGTLSQM